MIINIKNNIEKIEAENLKIKTIEKEEFILYLDWLFRFKSPILNQQRVFERLITKQLIQPKLKLNFISSLDFFTIKKISALIWNESLKALDISHENSTLTDYLIYEHKTIFNENELIKEIFQSENKLEIIKELKENKPEFQKFKTLEDLYDKISNSYKLNVDGIITKLSKEKIIDKRISRLVKLNKKLKSKNTHQENFEELANTEISPYRMLVIAEGVTEETLLPVFGDNLDFNFNKNGVKIITPGGKNPIVKFYTQIKDKLKIPIFILLDKDGVDIENTIRHILKKKDELYLIKNGEIEDILGEKLILKTLNNFYKNTIKLTKKDLKLGDKTTKFLTELYKEKGLEEFSKAHFANITSENITNSNITDEIKEIILKIKNLKANFSK